MNFAGHVVNALPPLADAYESGPNSTDIIDAQGGGVLFILYEGVGTTGTVTVTVDACDTVGPANTTAVPFIYRVSTTSDTWGAWTAATTAGFDTTAGSNGCYQIWVDPAELAEEGFGYVRMTLTELVDAVVIGGALAIVMDPRYAVVPSSLID